MDSELLSSFLATLKEVNATLLELTKVTAQNTLAIRLIGIALGMGVLAFSTWFFTHMDKIVGN